MTTRGFITIAQNNSTTNYIKLAYALALSLKATQKEHGKLTICVNSVEDVPDFFQSAFDNIIEIPWGDHAADSEWKLENEWKVYHISPYDETIKLDCDMLFTSDISGWWDILETKDLWCTSQPVDFRGDVIKSDYYRKTFTVNNLPNAYSAFTYFKKSDTAKLFFEMMEMIYHNWEKVSYEFTVEPRQEKVCTDVAYALALKLADLEDIAIDNSVEFPTFVHMKSKLQSWDTNIGEYWLDDVKVYLNKNLQLKIGHEVQNKPVHYHIKEALTDKMISIYENFLKENNK